jgi:O-antigen ligase
MAALGQPIVLGYVMMITLGFYLFIVKSIKSSILRLSGLMLVLAGLFGPLSRGPWVGAVVLIIVFIVIGPYAIKRLATLAIAVLLVIPFLGNIPAGQKIIDQLPFVGSTEQGNVDYRVKLLDNAFVVFKRYPMFGSVNYRDELADMGMEQGEHIVDVVNSYINIVLKYGLVGLSLFLGFFWQVLLSIYRSMKKVADKNSEVHLFGRTLFSCLIGILITISTVSPILVIPIIYWAIAGLGIAYARLVSTQGSISRSNNTEQPVLTTSRLATKT